MKTLSQCAWWLTCRLCRAWQSLCDAEARLTNGQRKFLMTWTLIWFVLWGLTAYRWHEAERAYTRTRNDLATTQLILNQLHWRISHEPPKYEPPK